MVLIGVISLIAGLAVGAGALFVLQMLAGEKQKKSAEREAERIIQRARSQVAKMDREARQKAKEFEQRARRNAENEIRKQKQAVGQKEGQLKDKEHRLEKDYKRREEEFNSKLRGMDEREERLKVSESRLEDLELQANRKVEELQSKLQKVGNMTLEEAKNELMKALEETARQEIAGQLVEIERKASKEAETKARRILSTAVARYASEVSTERTVSIVPLTSDEMKGKIIGREGRNIRALEAACGVDLIIDETPEAVVISSFDAVRREIARQTLERLMEDGRVHPARIEEAVDKVKTDLFKQMKEDGEKAALDLGVIGLHDELLRLLGSLKYRHSHNYNLFKHSLEVAYVAGLMAVELGEDVTLTRRAGLLHCIGRAIDHTIEGSYAKVGADFARKYGERELVVQAIRCHNGEKEAISVLDHIIQSAFQLVEARPGAKRHMMESYIRRLADLESVANSFDGVQKSFAIQSGKEIRVLVDSGKITDDQSQMLVRDIARKIERELNYPGQVKVTVVRETRIVEHAR